MAEMHAPVYPLEVGCRSLVADGTGSAGPAGVTHFVQGWEPVCGSERVRFVFPGRGDELGASCPDCLEAVGVPRQRAGSEPGSKLGSKAGAKSATTATRATTGPASRSAGATRTRRAS